MSTTTMFGAPAGALGSGFHQGVDAEPIQSVRHWVIRQSITNGLIASLVAGWAVAGAVGSQTLSPPVS